MARANLNVHEDVLAAFKDAQNSDSSVRSIVVKIEGESLVLGKSVDRAGSIEDDFNATYANCLEQNSASFVLFCQTDECVSGKQWVFMCWIPDLAKVRDKMLYSSSVEDLKRSLGLGLFAQDYSCSMPGDITWTAFQAATCTSETDSALTTTERQIKEEALQSRSESNVSKACAMGVLAFGCEEAALDALQRFRDAVISWAVFSVSEETVRLADTSSEPLAACAVALPAEPRFCVHRHAGGKVFFVYYCPEDSPVRLKMTMSSCKAAVAARLADAGVAVDVSLEVRDRADLEEEVRRRAGEALAAEGAGTVESVFGMGAPAASSKPTRPGRGRAKVSKFVSDLV
jgi:twinfilin